MALLDPYQDPTLEIDLTADEAFIVNAEVVRLQEAVGIIGFALEVPRRLSDATREELALDKKRCRRVLHPLRQCLAIWGGTPREPTSDERSMGAQLDWTFWQETHTLVTTRQTFWIATWAKRTGHLRFGKSAVVRLTQELEWLEYALRD